MKRLKGLGLVCVAAAVAGLSSIAAAVPPVFPDIEMPIDATSLVSKTTVIWVSVFIAVTVFGIATAMARRLRGGIKKA